MAAYLCIFIDGRSVNVTNVTDAVREALGNGGERKGCIQEGTRKLQNIPNASLATVGGEQFDGSATDDITLLQRSNYGVRKIVVRTVIGSPSCIFIERRSGNVTDA